MQKNFSIINEVLDSVINPPKYTGFVYVITMHEFTKIGKSENPLDRIRGIQTGIPYDVNLECIIPSFEMDKLEKSLHCVFKHKHHKGEWFLLDLNDIVFLRTLIPAGYLYKKTKIELEESSVF